MPAILSVRRDHRLNNYVGGKLFELFPGSFCNLIKSIVLLCTQHINITGVTQIQFRHNIRRRGLLFNTPDSR